MKLPIDYSQRISYNHTLADVTTETLFPHEIEAQCDLSEEDIIENITTVALYILEPIERIFGKPRINSGFRQKTKGKSQHEFGMALDLDWTKFTHTQLLAVAVWIKENLMFDQLIFEHGKYSNWIHISFDATKEEQRCMVLTMHEGNYEYGLKMYTKNNKDTQ
ncbi:MAG: D-Ala-D-Ala carboxypeptidase family metallohydrolase [Thiomicrorhabdus sp.]|jgi:hypothetical protein|nr:D-Ala-D-Ala carboxypeptidase family metallohydrolase [Thiomicrorhabdus sp.]